MWCPYISRGRWACAWLRYDVEDYQRIEKHIKKKLKQFPVNQDEVLIFLYLFSDLSHVGASLFEIQMPVVCKGDRDVGASI